MAGLKEEKGDLIRIVKKLNVYEPYPGFRVYL
jgi:hypothetical protein